MSKEKTYRAAMIVIGNEILSGRTQDKNVQYVGYGLTEKGIRLSEVRVVADIEQDIIEAVRSLRSKYDYVFTSGGIGPTHDDITAVTVAKAFDVEIQQNQEAYDILLTHYGEAELNDARLRMAQIPVGASLIPNPVSSAPGFQLENVYVMAGVPKIMQAMFDHVVRSLAGGAPVLSRTVHCQIYESELAPGLGDLQEQYPNIDIGSYPHYAQGKAGVNVVLRGTDEGLLDKVTEKVQKMIETLSGGPTET